MKIIDVIT